MLLASNFERGLGGWRPVNLAGSVTANLVSDGTAYSGSNFLRVSTTAPTGSVAIDLNVLRGVPGTNDFSADSDIAVWAWVRTAPGGPNVSGSLTVWQLKVDPSDPANHPSIGFSVNNTWTLVADAIDLASGSYDLRVEFYLDTVGTSLDIDCVFVN
jgi:hypothetical protein